MRYIRTLVIVIYSENEPVYKEHLEAWRLYSKRDPRFSVYFVTLSPKVTEMTLQEDILYVPGEEQGITQIHYKTVKAFEFFEPMKYDFILRTNMSSFWYFPNLLPVLQTMPKERYLTSELIGDFTSGAGFILTPDLCYFLIGHLHLLNNFAPEWADDARISYFLRLGCNIHAQQLLPKRFDVPTPFTVESLSEIPPETFHFRVKQLESRLRLTEPDIMRLLYHKLYEKKIEQKGPSE